MSCITIIDTIILTNYTNDAYLFDTYTAAMGSHGKAAAAVHSQSRLSPLFPAYASTASIASIASTASAASASASASRVQVQRALMGFLGNR
jgi:hypothetical protein